MLTLLTYGRNLRSRVPQSFTVDWFLLFSSHPILSHLLSSLLCFPIFLLYFFSPPTPPFLSSSVLCPLFFSSPPSSHLSLKQLYIDIYTLHHPKREIRSWLITTTTTPFPSILNSCYLLLCAVARFSFLFPASFFCCLLLFSAFCFLFVCHSEMPTMTSSKPCYTVWAYPGHLSRRQWASRSTKLSPLRRYLALTVLLYNMPYHTVSYRSKGHCSALHAWHPVCGLHDAHTQLSALPWYRPHIGSSFYDEAIWFIIISYFNLFLPFILFFTFLYIFFFLKWFLLS